MFSDRIKAKLAGLALVGAAFAIPAAAMAGVVVKASGPSAGSYPVGTQLEDDGSITLRAGDKITVLTSDGTRVMQGPGSFRVGEGATRTRARFSNLTRRRAATSVRTGAVRGAGDGQPGGAATNPNLWYVNVAAAGNICLYDLEAVRLWRPDADEPATYTILDQTTQNSLDVAFVGTESLRALDPGGLKISPGGMYMITAAAQTPGQPASVGVTFVALTEDFLQPDQLAQALFNNGCTTQLGLLADTLESSVD